MGLGRVFSTRRGGMTMSGAGVFRGVYLSSTLRSTFLHWQGLPSWLHGSSIKFCGK